MGKVEMQRRETIETLKKKGLLEKNNRHDLPPVLQRIAILSAEHAAGYQDFFKQLSDNQFGYDYAFTLFEVALQGTNTESTVIKALKEVNKRKSEFDCIVIIRGGGSKMDLASFDSLELNKAIANADLPVLTGIGHEIDETVADMVAYTSLKTPTAMAEFLIQRSYNFESDLMGQFEYLKNYTIEKIKNHQLIINQLEDRINSAALMKINNDTNQLDINLQRIVQHTQQRVKHESSRLPIFEKTLNLITVEATLDRGFTITKLDGKALKKTDKIKKGQTITTISQSSEITSTVEKVK
jgi:exodeoxyribonuclease VII large subunit